MKNLRAFALVLVGAMWGAAAVSFTPTLHAAQSYAVKSFRVGIGDAAPAIANGRPILGATAAGGTLTVTRDMSCTWADGSAVVRLVYSNGSGSTVAERMLKFPAARANAITDQFGNVIASSVPGSSGTAIDSFGSNLDTQIGTAATANKLNL